MWRQKVTPHQATRNNQRARLHDVAIVRSTTLNHYQRQMLRLGPQLVQRQNCHCRSCRGCAIVRVLYVVHRITDTEQLRWLAPVQYYGPFYGVLCRDGHQAIIRTTRGWQGMLQRFVNPFSRLGHARSLFRINRLLQSLFVLNFHYQSSITQSCCAQVATQRCLVVSIFPDPVRISHSTIPHLDRL
jgi:hypothetical protein